MFAADSLDQPSAALWEAARYRCRYINDLIRFVGFLVSNPDVPLPTNHLQHSVLQTAGTQAQRYELVAAAVHATGSEALVIEDAYAARVVLWQGTELTFSIHAPSDASFAAGPIGGEWHDRVQARLAAAVLTPDDPDLPDVEA